MNIFLIIFLGGTFLDVVINLILEKADHSFRKKHGREIPEIAAPYVDAETVDKTCRYEDAKFVFWVPQFIISAGLTVYLMLYGFYPSIFSHIVNWTENAYFQAILFMIIAEIPVVILSMPFDLYREFGIEKYFGFSHMTVGMWIADAIKSIIVGLLISVPLLSAVLFIVFHFENWWWLLAGGIYLVFSLGLSIIYPKFIAPLFNKFTPLPEGELKTRLEALLDKCGFKSNGLYVMDASKRSGHSNAYFTGFGKAKRVVLYDTLINQMTPEEIEAVLGHELGHYKHHHIIKKMAFMIPLVFLFLFAAFILLKIPALYEAAGFTMNQGEIPGTEYFFAGMFLLSVIFTGYGTLLHPVMNYFSRKDEFQADAFSKEVCGSGEPLVTALIKLNKENLSELQVPKVYSVFNYSHPPLLERIRALQNKD